MDLSAQLTEGYPVANLSTAELAIGIYLIQLNSDGTSTSGN